jgi:hypothetical protein
MRKLGWVTVEHKGDVMVGFADWLCNLLVWGAVITLLALLFNNNVAPILTGLNALIGLGVVVVLSLFAPRY